VSTGHCLHHATAIALLPREAWAGAIEQLPDACDYADCGAPRSCRQRNAEYLRVQWKIQGRLERIAAGRQADIAP
jgi:hypothetical protein